MKEITIKKLIKKLEKEQELYCNCSPDPDPTPDPTPTPVPLDCTTITTRDEAISRIQSIKQLINNIKNENKVSSDIKVLLDAILEILDRIEILLVYYYDYPDAFLQSTINLTNKNAELDLYIINNRDSLDPELLEQLESLDCNLYELELFLFCFIFPDSCQDVI